MGRGTPSTTGIGRILEGLAHQGMRPVRGTFAQNRHKIMPQVVPPSLLDFCRRDERELASLDFMDGLSVAFVIDEPERYTYVHRPRMEQWEVGQRELLAASLCNLQALEQETPPVQRFGRGPNVTLVRESFDGYDASRILLSQEMVRMSVEVPGAPVIAIPHRDYLVMFGDADPDFVQEMAERVRTDFEAHIYPITPRLFTLLNGVLVPYDPNRYVRVLH